MILWGEGGPPPYAGSKGKARGRGQFSRAAMGRGRGLPSAKRFQARPLRPALDPRAPASPRARASRLAPRWDSRRDHPRLQDASGVAVLIPVGRAQTEAMPDRLRFGSARLEQQ